MSSFMNNLKNEVKAEEVSQLQYTENMALGHSTSGENLVDVNFKIASYRSNKKSIIPDFDKAFHDDKNLAVKFLFFARDAREGLGERDFFLRVFSHLIETHKSSNIEALIAAIPFYGRWKDIFDIYESIKDSPYEKFVIDLITSTLENDLNLMKNKKPISLLSKWAPRENCSEKGRIELARHIMKKLDWKPAKYRKTLSALNKYLNTTEIMLSAKEFNKINYEQVPSLANLKYKNAFLRNDEERRREYLGKLSKGEVKMNMSVGYPHDIVHAYMNNQRFTGSYGWGHGTMKFKIDEALEGAWKNLPSLSLENTIVVGDSSGSMTATVGNTEVQAIEVAHALGIYCGDHNSGPFKNKMITFSERPKYLEWKDEDTLAAKLGIAFSHSEVANTNIEAVFDLILKTALKNHCSQEDLPKTILIISDMEFDGATSGRRDKTLFQEIKAKFKANNYEVPRCVFWNVSSRTNTIPMQKHENGVALVSGFSVQILKMVNSGKLDPFEILKEVLESDRYKKIIWE